MADVFTAERLDMKLDRGRWAFADQRRAEIDAYFAERQRAQPAIWNGRVLMIGRYALSNGVLGGRWFETDYASMLAWKAWEAWEAWKTSDATWGAAWGAPDATVRNGFALGALRSSDGAFLLGVMGAHTANAGMIYFPAGTPDPGDVVGDRVDLAGSVLRELEEETGIAAADVDIAPGWHVVDAGPPRLALIQLLRAREDAAALRERILRHLAAEAEPELADIRIVRCEADLDPMMPDFVTIFLRRHWRTDR